MTISDDSPLIYRVAVFRHEDVQAFLRTIGTGPSIQLVKDDGAYLGAWPAGEDAPVTVYAIGHEPPDLFQAGDADGGMFDSGWLAQRYRIEQTFGGDDFGSDVDPAALRHAAATGDVVFTTAVQMMPWPTDMPDLTGRREPIPRLMSVRGPHPAALYGPRNT